MALSTRWKLLRFGAKALLLCLTRSVGGLLATLILIAPAYGAADPTRIAMICETAASQAAQRYGIPVGVMQALTLTETGRKMSGRTRPWPWTLNVAGKGYWFDTRAEALEFVQTQIPKDVRSYDLGCFQINYRWHGDAFASRSDMFDPVLNADYAARFLRSLLPEFRTWKRAAGAYHSRTPKFAEKYERIFSRHLAAFDADDIPAPVLHNTPVQTASAPEISPKVVIKRTLLGQPEAWTSQPNANGSLSGLRRNPGATGLLRRTKTALY